MKNLDNTERAALEEAGGQAGAYLEELGKTDLAALTADEWDGLLSLIYTSTCDAIARANMDEVPF